jgi:hypothetical protein
VKEASKPDTGRKTGSALDTVIYWSPFKEGPFHEEGKPDWEWYEDCLRVKREMDQARPTESVRNGFSAQAVPIREEPAPGPARA